MINGPNFRNKEFNTETRYTRMEGYIRSVQPEKVRTHAREILDRVDEEGIARYRLAAALTQHVYNAVEYTVESDLWRADYILDHTQKGDCEDQATLLASLLVCRSFDIRFVIVEESIEEPGHVMLEVFLPESSVDDLVEEASDFYGTEIGLAWEEGDEGVWLVCNPTGSPVVGEARSNFFNTDRKGEVVWFDEVSQDYLRY